MFHVEYLYIFDLEKRVNFQDQYDKCFNEHIMKIPNLRNDWNFSMTIRAVEKAAPKFASVRSGSPRLGLPTTAQRYRSETETKISEDLFSLV